MIFQIPAKITKVQTLADGSLGISVTTLYEVTPEDAATLLTLKQNPGWMAFKEQEVSDKELPDEPVQDKADKTPSQRLRAVLFVVWKETTNQTTPFNRFYEDTLETIIAKYKEKLN